MRIRAAATVALSMVLEAVEAPGQTCAAIALQPVIVQDLTNAVFTTEFGDAVNATIATPRARGTIVDDDPSTP